MNCASFKKIAAPWNGNPELEVRNWQGRNPMESAMRYIIALAIILPLGLAASDASAAGKFCLKGPGQAMDCQYDTMAACNQAKKSGQSCAANLSDTTQGPAKKY